MQTIEPSTVTQKYEYGNVFPLNFFVEFCFYGTYYC